MKKSVICIMTVATMLLFAQGLSAQVEQPERTNTLYDLPPRTLVDMPTAGTLHRGYYNIGVRIYPNGGGMGYTDIGLSSRFMLGVSYGAEGVVAAHEPNWNPRVGFSLKFRLVDELEVFPAISVGYCDQGYGAWIESRDRYTYKSRGFYGVASRSFYFYKWTAGWHAGINYSLEHEGDDDKDINFFGGFDATFNYNLGFLIEYDVAINDDKSSWDEAGKGRGYLNMSLKWLFTENLELELVAKDLLVNRRESDTFTREIRMVYIDSF